MDAEKTKKDIKRAIEIAQSIHDDVVKNFVEADVDSVIKEQALVISSDLATLAWCMERQTAGSALKLACSVIDAFATNFIENDADSTVKERAIAVRRDLSALVVHLAHIVAEEVG